MKTLVDLCWRPPEQSNHGFDVYASLMAGQGDGTPGEPLC